MRELLLCPPPSAPLALLGFGPPCAPRLQPCAVDNRCLPTPLQGTPIIQAHPCGERRFSSSTPSADGRFSSPFQVGRKGADSETRETQMDAPSYSYTSHTRTTSPRPGPRGPPLLSPVAHLPAHRPRTHCQNSAFMWRSRPSAACAPPPGLRMALASALVPASAPASAQVPDSMWANEACRLCASAPTGPSSSVSISVARLVPVLQA